MESGKLLTQTRSELTLDALLRLEPPDSPLTRLHDRWKAGFQRMPFDPVILPETENPMSWRIPNHRDRWVPSWSKRVGDYPLKQHGAACALEYFECLSRNRPVCHAIEQTFEETTRYYTRLLLPVDGAIVYATRSLVPEYPAFQIG